MDDDDDSADKVTSVFVLHSDKKDILENQQSMLWSKKLRFISDPKKEIYKACGSKEASSKLSLLLCSAAPWIISSMIMAPFELSIKNDGLNNGGDLSMPADFLVDTRNGKIVASHYGETLADRWSYEDVSKMAVNYVASASRASTVA